MDQFGLDAIAVLEDDLYVSPAMYSYMKNAVSFYKDDDRIAGISLYKHEVNLFAKHPFYEIEDGGDTFFIQYAQSWGQVWIKDKWKDFIQWYENKEYENMNLNDVPLNVQRWNNSWLKYHIMYCIARDKYFAYPRVSLTTNYSDIGTHNTFTSTKVQVRFQCDTRKRWIFNTIADTNAVYDAFFENVKLVNYLSLDSVCIDLYGAKPVQKSFKYLLTRKVLPYHIVKNWGSQMRPIEENIILDVPGEELFLYDLEKSDCSEKHNNKMKLYEYDLKGVDIVRVETIRYIIQFIVNAAKGKIKKTKKKSANHKGTEKRDGKESR
jgi:hypothetical protein